MLSLTERLPAMALIVQGVALLTKPQPANAVTRKSRSDSTGQCCVREGSCAGTGVYCCYFKNDELMEETCGSEGAS